MMVGNIHDDLNLVAARERLCAHAKSLGSSCHGSILPAVYKAALAHSANHRPHRPADHSKDAILYVTVVIVFYAAIILLLVGTNLRRRSSRSRHPPPPPPPQIVVFDEKKNSVQQRSSPILGADTV